ncbi:MAG: hypothetical protein AMXMBFR7_47620 [Planctomycetota bacterium]
MRDFEVGPSRAERKFTAMQRGLVARAGYRHDTSGDGIEPMRLRLPEMCQEMLRSAGYTPWRLAPSDAVREVLSPNFQYRAAAANASGDLPNLLSALANKALMEGYNASRPTWRSWATVTSAEDFKTNSRVQLSDFAQLRETGENGEIFDSKLSDRAETFALAVYARRISFTLQMMINDDLEALKRMIRPFGKAGNVLPARLIYSHLLANPTMSDGTALFHGDHGNLRTGTPGSVLSATSLPVAISDFRKQANTPAPNDTEFAAEPLDVEPKILLVPPELEYLANTLANPNLFVSENQFFKNKFQVEVEPRLSQTGFHGNVSTTAWYLATGGENGEGAAEVCFLSGQQEPVMDSMPSFERLSVDFRAHLACAAKAMDWRRIHKNAGA